MSIKDKYKKPKPHMFIMSASQAQLFKEVMKNNKHMKVTLNPSRTIWNNELEFKNHIDWCINNKSVVEIK